MGTMPAAHRRDLGVWRKKACFHPAVDRYRIDRIPNDHRKVRFLQYRWRSASAHTDPVLVFRGRPTGVCASVPVYGTCYGLDLVPAVALWNGSDGLPGFGVGSVAGRAFSRL